MRFRALASMISTSNDYSMLKWPLLIISVLITFLALILLFGFYSNSWFTYEAYERVGKISHRNHSAQHFRSIENGSFGLWDYCTKTEHDSVAKCDVWTRRTRPDSFNVILVLASIALFLIHLSVFPSWVATIFVLYNINNRYIRYIVVFLWILFSLSLAFTVLLITILAFLGTSPYYSPGDYSIHSKYISFHTSTGTFLVLTGTIIASVCFILLVSSLISKKFIEMRLIEEDKQLYQQLTDDQYPVSWHEVIRIPRRSSAARDLDDEPPPYGS